MSLSHFDSSTSTLECLETHMCPITQQPYVPLAIEHHGRLRWLACPHHHGEITRYRERYGIAKTTSTDVDWHVDHNPLLRALQEQRG